MTLRFKRVFLFSLVVWGMMLPLPANAFVGQRLLMRIAWASAKSFVKNHPYLTAALVIYIFRHDLVNWSKEHVPQGVGEHPIEATVLVGIACIGVDYYVHQDEYDGLLSDGLSFLKGVVYGSEVDSAMVTS